MMLQGIFESLREEGVVRGYVPEDEEDQEFWVDGLKSENLEGLEALMSFVKAEDFGEGAMELSKETAFSIMRACSCLRLHLRENVLQGISDEDLENGEFVQSAIKGGLRDAFFIYVILAQLQSAVIETVDS